MDKGNNKGIIAFLVFLLVAIIVALVILFATGKLTLSNNKEVPGTSKENTIASTSQILSYYKELIPTEGGSDSFDEKKYALEDINNDGIPELFIYTLKMEDNAIIAITTSYTYDENVGNKDSNYVVQIGTIDGRVGNNTIFYKMNDGHLLVVLGKMGYETTQHFSLENGWLVRTSISSRETTEYITGDKEIEFISCDDKSLIENYK